VISLFWQSNECVDVARFETRQATFFTVKFPGPLHCQSTGSQQAANLADKKLRDTLAAKLVVKRGIWGAINESLNF